MKKYISLITLLLAFALHATAQSPTWAWALPWSGKSYEKGTCIATDAAGNIYAAGNFASDTLVNTTGITLINSSAPLIYGYDFYIIKYAPSGAVIWTKTFGRSTTNDEIVDITADASGNLYITGRSLSTTLTLGSYTLANPGAIVGIFIAKLDASGSVLWAKKSDFWSTSGGVIIPTAITADAAGNAIAIGHFTSPAIAFGTDTLTNTLFPYLDMYVVKYDASGNVLWAKSYGNIDGEFSFDVTTDKSNNICITGMFNSTSVTFGAYTVTNSISSPERFYLLKMDPDANILWAHTADGHAAFNGLTTDPSGNFIMAGFLTGTLTIGSTTLTASGGQPDILVAKYDNAGSFLWAKRAGSSNGDGANDIITDTLGNIYVAGDSRGTGTGPIFGDSILSNPGASSDLFVAKYTSSGTALWGITAKGGNLKDEQTLGIAIDPTGSNIYITGHTVNDTLQFGATTMIAPRISSNPHYNAFIAKLHAPQPTNTVTATNNNNIKIYPNPTENVLTIEGHNITEAIITDITGKEMLHQKAKSSCITIDVSLLVPGTYFVNVNTEDGYLTREILKR